MPRWSSRQATAELVARDPAFARLVALAGPFRMRPPRSGVQGRFESLTRAIVGQQLAGVAAATIYRRFAALFDGVGPTPEAVLALDDDVLRGAGLSGAKLASMRDLAVHVLDGRVELAAIGRKDDEAVVAELVQVRGIGRWTAEMFLMFELRRPDVWPAGDLGVRNGLARIHGWEVAPTERQMPELGEAYRPWRSVAAWYCWRAVETVTPEGW